MKEFGNYIINSKLYISFAAVALTIGTQIQLGGPPSMHPYLFIVFFATFLEYNLTRFILLVLYRLPLMNTTDAWVNKNKIVFYTGFFLSVIGLFIAILKAKQIVLLSLIPMILITGMYTLPFLRLKQLNLNLRKIPFLKIFVIMLVWTFSTVMLPLLQLETNINWSKTVLLLIERALLIGALALIFDLRDMEADSHLGLKTIPVMIGEKKSMTLSNILIVLFLIASIGYYKLNNLHFLIPAAFLSFLITLFLINYSAFKASALYHYFYIDGAMLLHGLILLMAFVFHTI